jgi:hypothetical protein
VVREIEADELASKAGYSRPHTVPAAGRRRLQRLLLLHQLTMHPLAHHAGEDSLVNLLLLGGGSLSVVVAIGRAQLAAARARLTRRVRGPEEWPHDGRR